MWLRWSVVLLACGAVAVMDGSDVENVDVEGNGTEGEVPVGRTLLLLKLLKQKLQKFNQLDVVATTPFPFRACLCVPFYLCSSNGTIITDGTGVIDLRYRQCTGDLEVCCFPRTIGPILPTTAMPLSTLPPTTLSTLPTTTTTTTTTMLPTLPTTTTTTTPRPTTLSTLPTTLSTTLPASLPLQYCFCIPIYQCAIYSTFGTSGTGIINPRQQPANTCVGTYVCCNAAAGAATMPTTTIVATTTSTFPPYVLPTIPTTAAPVQVAPLQLPPIVPNQSCICLLAALCSAGTIPMSGIGNIDPRLILGRQGQPAGTCGSANSMCCRLAPDGASQANVFAPNRLSTVDSDIKNAGTPNACTCVPMSSCAEGNAVTYDGISAIDPRFGPCASATLVCCRLQNRQRIDVAVGASTAQNLVFVNPPGTLNPQPTQAVCGLRDTTYASFSQQPAGTAYFAEFPWMAALLIRRPGTNDVFQCGGSLINSRAVLTAAHCVTSCDPGTLVARLGEWDTQNINEPLPFQEAPAQSIIVHPQHFSGALYHDVAIVILARPVTYAVNVRPACLPAQGQAFLAGTVCYASGWGRSAFGANGQYQTILRKVDLPIVDSANCQAQLRTTRLGPLFQLHPSFMCAGGLAKKDTCYKDGGGPLVCQDQSTERFIQAGIISWGIGCGDSTPAVYANVAQHRQWIEQTLLLNGIYN